MKVEVRFSCPLPNGVHARPASLLTEVVRRFESTVTIAKDGGPPVDARSVLSVVGLDIRLGDAGVLVVTGRDATAAAAELRALVEGAWAASDEVAAPAEAGQDVKRELPIGLRGLGLRHVIGRGVCGGVGRGVAVHVAGLALPPALRSAKARGESVELGAVHGAIGAVGADLRRRASSVGRRLEADLLGAHAEIADDPALRAEIEREIRSGATAPQAVVAACAALGARLGAAESAYVRDRALDVQDVCAQILERLVDGPAGASGGGGGGEITLTADSVVVAEALTASRLMKLDHQRLKGLVLGAVGATSHTVILARSMGVPTVLGASGPARTFKPGESLVVDGDGGFVLEADSTPVRRYFERRDRAAQARRARMKPIARRPGATADGVRLEVGANASTPAEVSAAIAGGAEGVGLLRTELLFLNRDTAPTEQEQFEAYAAVVEAAGGRPVIIRTFDIGGDKPARYLRMPTEDNPFLGCRGLRLYERHPELLRSQLRAVARAAKEGRGPVKVMAPMVATPVEAAWFRDQVRAVHATLPVGVMIEIPAAALVMDQIGAEVDFVSLGTNDLSQYWMAADRGNAAVAGLCSPLEPSFLRLLRTIVSTAKERGTWVGVCGEMAGRRLHLPLMVGLGVNEISVPPGEVMGLKALLAGLDSAACRALLDEAAACRTPGDVEQVLGRGERQRLAASPILDGDAITVGSDATTKEEAIRDAVDALFVIGRTERPGEVEEAVWARERTYSTGLGYGFAIPHCKTDAVPAPTLAVVTLRSPVGWGSTDGQPVGIVILLTVPLAEAAETHLRVFAALARRLMHEEFRARLSGAATAGAIHACLKEELGLA